MRRPDDLPTSQSDQVFVIRPPTSADAVGTIGNSSAVLLLLAGLAVSGELVDSSLRRPLQRAASLHCHSGPTFMPIAPDLLRGSVVLARAILDGASTIPALPVEIVRPCGDAIAALPPQWRTVGDYEGSGAWIDFAALVEAYGYFTEAWELLATLAAVLEAAEADPIRDNLIAFLWARRGRIARTAGWLPTAEDCYLESLVVASIDHDSYWTDVYPTAWIGRCVLAVERGNYPEARRCARQALHESIPRAHRAQAHQMLALIARKAGKLSLALEHLWAAFDQSDGHAAHQIEIISSLAEVAAEGGHNCAALRGWHYVISHPAPGRALAPALIGIQQVVGLWLAEAGDPCGTCIDLLAQSWWIRGIPSAATSSPLGRLAWQVARVAQTIADGPANPKFSDRVVSLHDRIELRLATARLLLALDAPEEATRLASRVRSEAEAAGFHERAFQSEGVLAQSGSRPAVRHSRSTSRHVSRLFALSSMPADSAVGV